jgi:hypothetical protein
VEQGPSESWLSIDWCAQQRRWFHDVIDLIAAYAQPEYLNVEMEYNDELRSDNFDQLEAMKAAKLVEADEKKKQSKGKKRQSLGN